MDRRLQPAPIGQPIHLLDLPVAMVMSIWLGAVRRQSMSIHKAPRSAWIGLAVLALPCMITVMDLTVLNLAVPHLSAALQPTGAQLLWIIDIYGFMLACTLIPIGGLGDRIGRRKLLLLGAAAFGAASVLAAFSTSALMLIATRALLGLAGAALVPSTLSLLRTMFEDDVERTKAIGVWGASFAVGAAIGPLVGGVLDLTLFRNSAFNVALITNVQNVFVSFGSFILISQYLQLVLGLSPLQAGLLSLPASLLAIAGPMLSPVLAQRIGTPSAVAGMLVIAALGFGVQTVVGGPLAVVTLGLGWALWALGGSAAATLTTGTIIGSAPPERAGAVSALGQTGAELGGALGIAVLGSLGTAIYRGMVTPVIPRDISPELAAAAHDTLAGALSAASQIPDSAAAVTLVMTAQDALATAVHVTSAIGALTSIAMAVAVAVYFRDARPERQKSSTHSCAPEPVTLAA